MNLLEKALIRCLRPLEVSATVVQILPYVRREMTDPTLEFYRRALSCFRPDRARIALLGGVIVAQIGVGMLQACPLAVLVDGVLGGGGGRDWMQRLFLSPLP